MHSTLSSNPFALYYRAISTISRSFRWPGSVYFLACRLLYIEMALECFLQQRVKLAGHSQIGVLIISFLYDKGGSLNQLVIWFNRMRQQGVNKKNRFLRVCRLKFDIQYIQLMIRHWIGNSPHGYILNFRSGILILCSANKYSRCDATYLDFPLSQYQQLHSLNHFGKGDYV